MERVDYKAYFLSQHPDFFAREYVKNIPEGEAYEEMALDLKRFQPGDAPLPKPEGVSFGWYDGPNDALVQAVEKVEKAWVKYYGPESKGIYCAMKDGRVASFCTIEAMGEFAGLRFAGPGCVGTVPEFRKQGIGLYMVRNATLILKDRGYDVSYIHYTGVGHWYARLGYETVLRWDKNGFVL